MKKVLTAIGFITACTGAVQAQSSVTIYGIMDAGYVGGNARFVNPTTGVQTKATASEFGQNAESSSRFGFRGNEDLGGGISAFFTVESQINPQGTTPLGINRQSFVGIKKLGLGESAIGLQYTPIFKAALVTDPGNLNNIAGNLIYASAQAITSASAGSTAIGFTARTSNTISFKTERFAGFSAGGIYTLSNKNQSQTTTGSTITGGNIDANGWGLSADYAYNKLFLTAAYQALKQVTTSVTTVTTATAYPWTNAVPNTSTTAPFVEGNALNVEDNQFYAAGTYDFGVLKAYAQYLTRKATSTLSKNYYLGRSAQQIGVRSFITPTIEGWASAGLGRYTEMGNGSPTANFNGWQAGSNYWFSKRTNLYAIYGQTAVSNGTTAGGITTSANLNNYAVGLRHTF